MEKLNELKSMKADYKNKLKSIMGNNKVAKECRAYLKDCIEKLDYVIWKLEDPNGYENHKNAISEYVLNTHII